VACETRVAPFAGVAKGTREEPATRVFFRTSRVRWSPGGPHEALTIELAAVDSRCSISIVPVAPCKIADMLYMVIERLKPSDLERIGRRLKNSGRGLPPGVVYHASWIDAACGRCFQVMEAENSEALAAWTAAWQDLVDFEIIPVTTSSEFWRERETSTA